VAILGALLCLGGCTHSFHVEQRGLELGAYLDGFDEPARKCAPRALADARTHLVFASYEAELGQTTRAWHHMSVAERSTREAFERSKGPECEKDSDYDGIRDSKDICVDEPEDFDGDRDDDGCPDYDKDGDGIDDADDHCPKLPEDKDDYNDEDGCPDVDNDGDGIKDEIDQCPNEPEDRDGFQDIDGCPEMDNDGDKIPDSSDNCPNQAEDFDGDNDEDGCPDIYKQIVVTETRIELKQKIYFKTGKAKILPKSFELLNEVADVLIKNGKIGIRVEGHTDTRGSDRYNKRLSQKRADSVKAFIVKAGVEASRLIAVGYGEEVPIDSNSTRAGRAKNRRVEFHIIR
jgi:outer membrane protein OmpA-like peptidoglycan-associated protein